LKTVFLAVVTKITVHFALQRACLIAKKVEG